MRVIMTGGGTGGHVNPGLAIVSEIVKQEPDSEVLYVGTKRGIENKLVGAKGYKIKHVEVRGLKRSLSPKNFKALYLAVTSPHKAKKIIKDFSPDVVIGTGGYVCWPVMKAAADMKIPTALHESNSIAGVAIKMLQDKVDRIYLNFEATGKTLHAKEKLLRVGNPLPSDFENLSHEDGVKKLGLEKYGINLLSYGGSLGAHNLNCAVLELMKYYTSKHPEIHHTHATGAGDYAEIKAKFEEYGLDKCENLELVEYIYDMPVKMAAADVVICRAGAMTVSELALSGTCPIFVPSPFVAENHQYKNAKVIVDADAGIMVEEKEILEDMASLTRAAEKILDPEAAPRRYRMSENIKAFAVRDASRLIYEDIKKLLNKG